MDLRDDREVPPVAGLSGAAIEHRATAILRIASPSCLSEPKAVDMLWVFEFFLNDHFGVTPFVQDLPSHIQGLTHASSRVVILNRTTYEALERNEPSARFAVAHELGHVVLHAEQLARRGTGLVDLRGLKLYRRVEIPPYLDPEWQANRFAAAFLMPATMVPKTAIRSRLSARHVADAFKVSYTAASLRLRHLGYVEAA